MNPNDEKLAQFAEDTVMFHAVKAMLEAEFDLNKQVGDTNNHLGLYENVLATFQGRERLQRGFKVLEKYKRDQNSKPEVINSHI